MGERDARTMLAALAGDGPITEDEPDRCCMTGQYHERIEQAIAARSDLETATAYLAEHGLEALEDAVERAEHDLSGRAGDGREALEQLRDLERASRGDSRATPVAERQFQSGLSSPLGSDDLADSR